MQKITYYNATKTREVLVSVNIIPVYYLAKKPNRNVLATSYNQDLAKTFGRQTRDHAREKIVEQSFPDFRLSDESRAVDDWRTTQGGTYYATGIGGSTTGRAATLLLVDDPIKAREEADSATQRNKTCHITSVLSQLESNLNQMGLRR